MSSARLCCFRVARRKLECCQTNPKRTLNWPGFAVRAKFGHGFVSNRWFWPLPSLDEPRRNETRCESRFRAA
jgi:hypothetical protein